MPPAAALQPRCCCGTVPLLPLLGAALVLVLLAAQDARGSSPKQVGPLSAATQRRHAALGTRARRVDATWDSAAATALPKQHQQQPASKLPQAAACPGQRCHSQVVERYYQVPPTAKPPFTALLSSYVWHALQEVQASRRAAPLHLLLIGDR